MTIQIEEGTYYRTHGGRKVGPLVEIEPDRDPPLQFDAWSDGSDTWDADGAHCDDSKCDDTIVAEWADDQAAIDRLAAIVADEKLPPGVRVDAADSMWRARPTGSFSTQMTDAEIVAAIEAAEASLAGQTRGDFDRDRDRANREVFETAPAPQTAAGVVVREGGYYRTAHQVEHGLWPMGPMRFDPGISAFSVTHDGGAWTAHGKPLYPMFGEIVEECAPPHADRTAPLSDHIAAQTQVDAELVRKLWEGLAPPEPAPEKADVKAEIADEAKRIVSGARRTAYGTPESNFERIARFWQAYLENTGRGDAKITAADVSPMMRLMKEARLCETPDHRDSFVDLVGYTLTGAEVNGVQPLTPDKPQA